VLKHSVSPGTPFRVCIPGLGRALCLSTGLLLLACPPATTRPAFRPFPDALNGELRGEPPAVIEEARRLLVAEGAAMAWFSSQDGYLESQWFNALTKQAGRWDAANPDPWVTVRVWADPGPPGKTLLTFEVVYKPLDDPSRQPRDLEKNVPPGHGGYELGRRLMNALREKFR
jgi:hypothetical protein